LQLLGPLRIAVDTAIADQSWDSVRAQRPAAPRKTPMPGMVSARSENFAVEVMRITFGSARCVYPFAHGDHEIAAQQEM
jgi:hypothetical protein